MATSPHCQAFREKLSFFYFRSCELSAFALITHIETDCPRLLYSLDWEGGSVLPHIVWLRLAWLDSEQFQGLATDIGICCESTLVERVTAEIS